MHLLRKFQVSSLRLDRHLLARSLHVWQSIILLRMQDNFGDEECNPTRTTFSIYTYLG